MQQEVRLIQRMVMFGSIIKIATYAVANGTDIKTVSELLGHEKIQTTEYYIPTLYDNVKTAI